MRPNFTKVLIDGLTDYEGDNPRRAITERFNSEMGWRVKQAGLRVACEDWLRGLALNIDYENYHIVKNIYQYSDEKINKMPDYRFTKIVENYWASLREALMIMVTIEQGKYAGVVLK